MNRLLRHSPWSFVKVLSLYFVMIVGLFVLVAGSISIALAQPSYTVNYQGKLTDTTGLAVANGTYEIEFNLYTVPTGGTAIWTETRSGGNEVTVTNGLFSVMLGSVSNLSGVNFNQPLYLGVTVEADAEMTPRKPIGTVPSAFEAQKVGGVASSSFVRSDAADTASGLLTFTGGLISNASSTVARLSFLNATGTSLRIGGDTITDFTGSNLQVIGGALGLSSTYIGQTSITTLGTISTGVWQGTAIGDTYISDTITVGAGSTLANNIVTPDSVLSSGQTDEYCLTYESGDTFEWQTCSSVTTFLALTDTPSSYNSYRIPFTNSGATALTDSASFTFNDSTGTLTVGNSTFGSLGLSFANAATTTIANNNPYAFTIATSTGANPLFRIDTTAGSEAVIIGSGGSDIYIGDIGAPANLVFEESSTISGQGTNTITLGVSGDIFSVASGVGLGVGTTTPWQEFSVNGDMVLTGRLYDTTASAGTNGMVLQTTGSGIDWVATSSLGFGTSFSNSAQLAGLLSDETGYSSGALAVFSISPTITGTADFEIGDFSGNLFLGTDAYISSAGYARMEDGLVGSPAYSFENDTNTGMYVTSADTLNFSTAGVQRLVLGATGNVGIGTSTPNQLLTVQGNINLSSANGGIYFDDTRYLYASSTNDSLVFGEGAGANFTSATLNNIAIGRFALDGTSPGSYNVAIGGGALGYTDSGSYNVAVGHGAGGLNSDETHNVFIGYAAGQDSGATHSVVIGSNASHDSFTESSNIMGYFAARYVGAASSTVIGNYASEGGYLTDSITIGNYSAYNASGIDKSVILGNYAGYNLDGDNNILLGYGAGGNMTTGNNNILIGYDIDNISATADNVLNIGNIIFGTNISATGTAIDTDARIGIGVTAPQARLNILGANSLSTNDILFTYDSSGNYRNGIANVFQGGNAALNRMTFLIGDGNAGGQTNVMTLAGDGNVGIGTTSPMTRFTVVGDSRITGAFRDSSGDAGTSGQVLLSTLTGTNWVATSSLGISSGSSFSNSAQLAALLSDETGTGAAVFGTAPTLSSVTISSGGIIITGNSTSTGHLIPGANDTYDLGTNANRWRDIFLGGETIHLGTSLTDEATFGYNTSTNILNIGTDSTTNGDIAFFTDDLYLDKSSGNVGIGTTTPSARLSVTAPTVTVSGSELITNGTFTGSATGWTLEADCAIYGSNQVTVTYDATCQGSSDYPSLSTTFSTVSGTTYRVTFTLSNVSDDTVTMSLAEMSSLDIPYNSGPFIEGTHTVYFNSGYTGTETISFVSTGYVTDGTWTIDNVSVQSVNSGTNSVFYASGYNGETLFSYSLNHKILENTFFGEGAGALNDVGYNNTFFGTNAGTSNTIGDSNTFFGTNAGLLNEDGFSNTFIGVDAGMSNVSGTNNTFFGRESGRANTTGEYNTFLGTRSGYSNTVGEGNTFVGAFAGDSSEGSSNVFVGNGAGFQTNASQNIFIGNGSGGFNVAGWDNVFLGNSAGAWNEGSANILIGSQTGDELATGNNNILIGYDVEAPDSAANNVLNIGNLIFGTGLDATSTALSSGNIGIGTSSPASKLSVAGDLRVTGGFRDSSGDIGTNGQVLLSTGSLTNWVATSSLGIGGSSFSDSAQLAALLSDETGSGSGGLAVFNNSPTIITPTFTTSATVPLIIGGSATSQQLILRSSSGNATTDDIIFQMGNNGGTPWGRLDNENDSVSFGQNAGSSFNSGTNNNVALGYGAGQTVSSSAADSNNFIGVEAGYANSGANSNLIGLFAGRSNTGSYNNLIGAGAGYSNTGGTNNIIGNEAGYSNSGTINNLFGSHAGRLNTGDFNNLFGPGAGYSNTGDYNNFFGYEAGYNNIGSANNFIGVGAGYYNTGSYNEFIGFGAGYNLRATGTIAIGREALNGSVDNAPYIALNNVAIGYRAGYNATNTADNNILLGYQAADNLTTGNNNIIIGYNIDNITATADNRLNIGNLLFGTGLDGTGTTLASGNIGIGTSTPSQKLQVQGNVRITGTIYDSSNDAGTNGQVLLATGSGLNWVATSSLGLGGGGSLFTDGGANTYLTATGDNLSIGGTGGSAKLNVYGNIDVAQAASGISFMGTRMFYASTTNDSIAIGEGAGYSFTSGTMDNIAIGYDAGRNVNDAADDNNIFMGLNAGLNSSGDHNHIFGDGAGDNNVGNHNNIMGFWAGSSNDGDFNNFFGNGAGYNSTGDYNIFVGYDVGVENAGSRVVGFGDSAGYNNIGNDNLFIGSSAGGNNVGSAVVSIGQSAGTENDGNDNLIVGTGAGYQNTGSDNILIGYEAGAYSTGSSIVALGHHAGRNSTSSDNIFIGYQAGYDNTGFGNNFLGTYAGYENTGNRNSAFGYSAGGSNAGDENVFFGYYAGTQNTGDDNIMMGYFAGRYLSATTSIILGSQAMFGGHYTSYNSQNNVAIGYAAGYNSDDGSGNNILIGYQAADNLTTGNNNIIIGYDIDNVSNTADNRLNIGNLIFGTGLDGTGTTLASGNVGIGTTSPSSILAVQRSQNSDLTVSVTNLNSGSSAEASFTATSNAGSLGIGIWGTAATYEPGAAYLWNWANTDMYFGTNNTERIRIEAGGNVGIGDTSPASLFTVGNGDLFQINSSGVIASSNNLTPNAIFSTGQADEECLTYEATGATFEWQSCASGFLASTDIDTSAELDTIVTDDTGSGALVFGTSPTFTTSALSPAFISTAADPADAGVLRLGNAEVVGWEASPAGTDVSLSVNASEQLVFTGGAAIIPSANDGASLGVSGTAFSDLYLASGGVINFAAGDVVMNHTTGYLSVSSGDLRVVNYGSDATSVVTVGGTQTLTNKTLTAPNLGTPTTLVGTNITGTAASLTAGVGSTVTLTADNSTNATNYPLFVNAATGNLSPRTDTGFTYNPSTGALSTALFASTAADPADAGVLRLGNAEVVGWEASPAGTDVSLSVNASEQLVFTGGAAIIPSANDGASLGVSGTAFSDLFLASGAVINFVASDVTVTHASNALTFAGASSGYTFDANVILSGAAANISLGSNYLSGDGADEGVSVGTLGEVAVTTTAASTNAFSVTGDSLTTGNLAYIYSNSATTNTRNLLNVINDNTLATGAVALRVQQDSTGDIVNFFDGATEIFTILDGGNVGIGDTSPASLFTVGNGDLFQINSSGVIASSNNLTPNAIFSTGQADEECLTYEATGATFEWQSCASGFLASTDIDTSAELATILTDETGYSGGALAVFSISPVITGTADFVAGDFSSTLTFSGTAANMSLGSNYLSGDGADEGISVSSLGEVAVTTTAATTNAFTVTGDSLTTGTLARFYSNSSNSSTRSIVDIINDNTSATAAVALRIQQDSTADIVNFFDGATEIFTILDGGDAGIGVSDPDSRLEVFETVGAPQFKLSYDASNYASFQTASNGDLQIDASGGDVVIGSDNLYICDGGSCASSPANAAGNITAERAITSEEYTLGTSGSITVNWDNSNQQIVDGSTGNLTFDFSNATNGQTLRLVVCFGGTHTINWTPTIRWAGGVAPTPTSTNTKCDVFSFLYTGSEYLGQSSLNF